MGSTIASQIVVEVAYRYYMQAIKHGKVLDYVVVVVAIVETVLAYYVVEIPSVVIEGFNFRTIVEDFVVLAVNDVHKDVDKVG